MLATGLDGVVVYHNPAFATMLGHHPLFFRATEQILLIGITDITELIWDTPPEAH